MFNWTLEYIISQILIVIVYILICTTYFLKNRRKILITNIIAHIFQAGSFLLLNGLTGVAMNTVYVIRDSFFTIDEKNRKNSKLTKRDYIILAVFILIIITFTIFTYSGCGSLLSVVATIISTIAIWQKSTKYYKLLGIPVSMAWLGYYIFLQSIFAIVLESILLISTITGYLIENKKAK
jgi:hypothetical protein